MTLIGVYFAKLKYLLIVRPCQIPTWQVAPATYKTPQEIYQGGDGDSSSVSFRSDTSNMWALGQAAQAAHTIMNLYVHYPT